MHDPQQFLTDVWTQQGQGFGFVSLRTDDLSWRDFAIKFPQEEIVIPDALDGDLYFTPNLFRRPRRRKGLALPSCWLYADLDGVDPRLIRQSLRPTVAWESSPGRFQAMWELRDPIAEEDHSSANQRLTYTIGADKGGWGSTKVLRIPGTLNHKYQEKPRVELLWA